MKEKIAKIAILANLFLAGSKIAVGFFSNSAAILASGIDSFVDIFSSTISFIGIKIAKKPADKKHPYGHYKFEVVAGVLITLFILATGIGIIYDAYRGFFEAENIKISYLAFGIMVFSVLVNEIMARLKIHYGKKENSVSLISDGMHSRIDVFTSLAVFGGLILTRYWIYSDALLAFLIGLYIIKESFSLGKEAVDSLLDVSAPEEIEQKIKEVVKNQKIKLEELKTQKKGSFYTANLIINLPNNLKIDEATKISEDLRENLIRGVENLSYVAIQIKSHDMETSFYKPFFGKGFGWRKGGRFKGEIKEAAGRGPGGNCVCKKCGYTTSHERGVPCSSLKCPKCKIPLQRE